MQIVHKHDQVKKNLRQKRVLIQAKSILLQIVVNSKFYTKIHNFNKTAKIHSKYTN